MGYLLLRIAAEWRKDASGLGLELAGVTVPCIARAAELRFGKDRMDGRGNTVQNLKLR